MDEFADADEQEAAGDPEIQWDRLDEVAAIFAEMEPLDALKAIYGDGLDVPA
jgi:hypothetical protein